MPQLLEGEVDGFAFFVVDKVNRCLYSPIRITSTPGSVSAVEWAAIWGKKKIISTLGSVMFVNYS